MRKDWMKLAALVGLAGSTMLFDAGIARAQYYGPYGNPYFYGREYRHFRPYEMDLWRGGRWIQGWHGGRYGWWWYVGGVWYPYDQPTYPFPAYAPAAPVMEAPPPVVAAPAMPAGPPSAQAQTWYYCENPKGYYPYVQSCPSQWRQVPAAPGGPSKPPR